VRRVELFDFSALQHHDAVAVHYSVQTMRDDQTSAIPERNNDEI
jgi:hypothetical protein